jgi:hypothetical protein
MPRASSEAEQRLPCFYEIPEDALYHMARAQYATCFNVATGFSCWAASLHLVLCYARYLNGKYETDTVHVVVIDRRDLGDEVLVWHVPHLLGYGNHEYLAFGRIRGNGYRAVSLADLDSHGLEKIFPELERKIDGLYGREVRRSMLSASAEPVELDFSHLYIAMLVGSLIGNLAFPVATALACPRPRPWRSWRRSERGKLGWEDYREDIITLAKKLDITSAPAGLSQEAWLVVGMVDTLNYTDVRQWVDLMTMITEALEGGLDPEPEDPPVVEQQPEPRANGRKRGRDDTDEPSSSAKRTARRLRPEKKISYRSCASSTSGKCISCVRMRR